MRAAVVALACLLRFAVTAQAAEIVRVAPAPVAPSTAVPASVAAPDPTKPTEPAPAPKPVPPREAAKPRADVRDGWRSRVCFSAAQTRENVVAHRLAEPFRALRVGGQQGEALRAKLCRWKQDEWVYEVYVLRRDGRIARVYMNAQNGQAVGALDDADRK